MGLGNAFFHFYYALSFALYLVLTGRLYIIKVVSYGLLLLHLLVIRFDTVNVEKIFLTKK